MAANGAAGAASPFDKVVTLLPGPYSISVAEEEELAKGSKEPLYPLIAGLAAPLRFGGRLTTPPWSGETYIPPIPNTPGGKGIPGGGGVPPAPAGPNLDSPGGSDEAGITAPPKGR